MHVRELRERLRIAAGAAASSIVTDTLTSDVVTTSTASGSRANTSNSRCRKPCAISMRVDEMSMRVTPRLQAMATGPDAAGASPVASMRVPGVLGLRELRMRTGMSFGDRREDGARVQHLRAEVRELGRLVEREALRHDARVRHQARIAGEHAVDVGPDLDLGGAERSAEERGRVVRPAAAERRGDAGARWRRRSRRARDMAGGQDRLDVRRPDSRGRGSGQRGRPRRNVSSVTRTWRASTHVGGTPASVSAARRGGC